MTQEQVYDKVKNLIKDGKLEIARGKILIPIPDYFLEEKEVINLYVTYNVEKKKISSEIGNSIRASLKAKNVNLYKIRNETLPLSSDGYCRLSQIDQIQRGKEFKMPITLPMAFRAHMENGRPDKTPETFELRKSKFFKYLPQLISIHESFNRNYFEEGYCCEEHDGPIENQYDFRYKNAVDTLSIRLSQIKEI